MTYLFLFLLFLVLIMTWIGSIARKMNKTNNPVIADINMVTDPFEAAAALLVAVGRMDTAGKLTGAQSKSIREELQNQMHLTPGQSAALLQRMRTMSSVLNRAQSVFPAVSPALLGNLTETEITELIAMMTRVAETEGLMNRDQMEFISEVQNGLSDSARNA